MSDTKLTLEQVQQTYGQMVGGKELFYDWKGANSWFFKFINNNFHSDAYDAFVHFVTQLGDKNFFLPYLTVLLIYAVVTGLWRKLRRKAGTKQHFIMWFGVFAVLIAGTIINYIVVSELRDYFQYPSPSKVLPDKEVVLLEQLSKDDARRSFPSEHVALATSMIVGLWPVLSPHMRAFGLFLIALVAWSRIALGVNFPADAIGTFLITGGIIVAVRALLYAAFRKLFGMNCGGG